MTDVAGGPNADVERARALADQVPIQEIAADRLKPHHLGQVLAWPEPGEAWRVIIARKAGIDAEYRQQFEAWARQRIYMLLLVGHPEADGWWKRSVDDGWQCTARPVNGRLPLNPGEGASPPL